MGLYIGETKVSPVILKEPETIGDVVFYDYDGEVVTSYSASDFANLTAMPENPTHEGLTAQGWNWTLADAKAYVANNGQLDIGQMYVTDDNKTRIYITLQGARLEPYLGIGINGSVVVDWGDGNTETITGKSIYSTIKQKHTYSEPRRLCDNIKHVRTNWTYGTNFGRIFDFWRIYDKQSNSERNLSKSSKESRIGR